MKDVNQELLKDGKNGRKKLKRRDGKITTLDLRHKTIQEKLNALVILSQVLQEELDKSKGDKTKLQRRNHSLAMKATRFRNLNNLQSKKQ